jgi:cytochrome c-type biogenesis protein CcmH/NrfF
MGILWEVGLVLLLLGFAVWEVRSVRRSIRADREKAATAARPVQGQDRSE